MIRAGAERFLPVLLTNIGEALLLAGRPEEAREQTEQALALARRREERGSEALALRCLGDIASRADGGDATAAERHYQDSISIVRTCANCGAQLPGSAKFCPECAHPTGLSAAPSPAQRFGAALELVADPAADAVILGEIQDAHGVLLALPRVCRRGRRVLC